MNSAMNVFNQVNDYYVRLWGDPSRIAEFSISGVRLEINKWNADVHPEEVAFYITNGLSSYELKGFDRSHRLEIFIGFLPEEDEIAQALASFAISPILDGIEIGPGHTMTFTEPLWNGTQMQTLIVSEPRVQIVPPLFLDSGVHVEFLQAIPLFPSELKLKKEKGYSFLLNQWERNGVPFWDPHQLPST